MSLNPPVVRCPTCGGKGAVLQSSPTGHHRPTECSFCAGRGLVRAQLVVSVVDLPTGRVASRSIVPGALVPVKAAGGQAALDLRAVVQELAGDLDVPSKDLHPPRQLPSWHSAAPYLIPLRHAAGADISDDWRFEYEGAEIAREARLRPHLIFYAGGESKPMLSADDSLRRLIALAGDLQLDLVIEVRVGLSEALTWNVRLALPGGTIPGDPQERFNTLHRALSATGVDDALARLRTRSTVRARWLETASTDARPDQEELSWAELSARLTPLAVQAEGAIGVLRRGQWFFSSLESALDPENDLRSRLRPTIPIPEPTGVPIPLIACPKCAGESAYCYRCDGEGVVLDGLGLTITDLETRTKHVNWRRRSQGRAADEHGRGTVSGVPLGSNEILLDRQYSVGEQAKPFGIPPHLLHDHHRKAALSLSLVDGKLDLWLFDENVDNRDVDPLVSRYLQAAAGRRPGGRLIVLARPEPRPPIEELFRSVLGLGLTLAVEVKTAQPGRMPPAPALTSWRIVVLPPTPADRRRPEGAFGSSSPSLRTAVADLEARFDSVVSRALKVGKLEPIPIPQRASPVRVDVEAIERSLEGLSEIFPGTDIWWCIDLNSWTCFVGAPYHRSASAATVQEAFGPLVAPDLVQPRRADLRRLLNLILDEDATDGQLETEVDGLQGRFTFGLVLWALLKCLFVERFGLVPEQARLDEYAAETYRDALGAPSEDDEPPVEPAVLSELLASIVDPSRTAWRRMLLEDHLSAMLQILGSLLRDRLETGAETSAMVDQVVEEGMLMARAVRESVGAP